MPFVNGEEKGTGFVPDTEDSRDKEYDHLAYGASPFDWNKGFDIEAETGIKLKANDQNGSLSCVGQGVSKYVFVMNYIETGTQTDLYAKSVYSQIAFPKGTSSIRDAFKLLKDYGINEEVDVPSYEKGKPPSEKFMAEKKWLNDELKSKAKTYKSKEYRAIMDKKNIDTVAQAIRDNYGVVMGFDGENNGTWHSTHPQTPSKRAWSHCIYGGKAKLIDGKKYVGFLNSWGEDVGEDGWQWFGEEWFKDGWTSNIWTMTDKPNTFRTKLLDKDGKPRYIPTKSFKFISYLLRRGYTISK